MIGVRTHAKILDRSRDRTILVRISEARVIFLKISLEWWHSSATATSASAVEARLGGIG